MEERIQIYGKVEIDVLRVTVGEERSVC